MPTIVDSLERRRGCGWRKPGGLYIVGGGPSAPCGKLPVPLTSCTTCGIGIRPTPGFQWFNPVPFLDDVPCPRDPRVGASILTHTDKSLICSQCPLYLPELRIGKRAGLMWASAAHYPTAESYTLEAAELGVSKRVSAIPKGITPGTWCFIAHRKAVPWIPGGPPVGPGVVLVFKVSSLDYIVKGDETPEQLERIEKRGLRLVRVIPDDGGLLHDNPRFGRNYE